MLHVVGVGRAEDKELRKVPSRGAHAAFHHPARNPGADAEREQDGAEDDEAEDDARMVRISPEVVGVVAFEGPERASIHATCRGRTSRSIVRSDLPTFVPTAGS